MEQSLVLIKPEAMQKKMMGYVLNKLAEKDIEIVGIKTVKVTKELAKLHYEHLKDKPFFDDLIEYFLGAAYGVEYIIAIVYEGKNAIVDIRDAAGATHPEDAAPTTIRGLFGRITRDGIMENTIHASSDKRNAEREIKMWFKPAELMSIRFDTKIVKFEKEEKIWS